MFRVFNHTDNTRTLPYLEYFAKLLGAPGSPNYRAYGHLHYFEKLDFCHTTVCNDEEDDTALLFSAAIMGDAEKDLPHLEVGR